MEPHNILRQEYPTCRIAVNRIFYMEVFCCILLTAEIIGREWQTGDF